MANTLVSDALWVAAAKRILAEDGPDQFLVNLLFVLRQTLGTPEENRQEPP